MRTTTFFSSYPELPSPREPLEHKRRPATPNDSAWGNALQRQQHPTLLVGKHNIQGVPHKERVDRRALGKPNDIACTPLGPPTNEPPQPFEKRVRCNHPAGTPTSMHHGDAARNRNMPAVGPPAHTSTPGRQGSTVTSRTCPKVAGAPIDTPAMLNPDGQGLYIMVQLYVLSAPARDKTAVPTPSPSASAYETSTSTS